MRIAMIALAAVLASGCVSESAVEPHGARDRGRQLAQTHCSSCHAIGVEGESPAPEAPLFRRLSQNYRVDALEEALAEGISVGHPAMPQFRFAPDDVDALVAYLSSIQEPEQ